jgi:hypothetical protein
MSSWKDEKGCTFYCTLDFQLGFHVVHIAFHDPITTSLIPDTISVTITTGHDTVKLNLELSRTYTGPVSPRNCQILSDHATARSHTRSSRSERQLLNPVCIHVRLRCLSYSTLLRSLCQTRLKACLSGKAILLRVLVWTFRWPKAFTKANPSSPSCFFSVKKIH